MKSLPLLLTASGLLAFSPIRADDQPLPGSGFEASRYEVLWTKSPFAVAASETAQGSSDYALKGVVKIDGISYINLIDNNNQGSSFLLSSDKPARGLTLVSVALGHDGSDTQAVVQKDGKWITLKLDKSSGAPPPAPNAAPPMPGSLTQQIPMPGSLPGAMSPPNMGAPMPLPRFRRHAISLPPNPQQQQQPPPENIPSQ
ncbi:MAG: hypothetical protein LV479_08520 [Methylacidiphilales bacterium]|nr:hypothetical protein [Candidatus Methylacidiphilales bacterium]